MTTQPFTDLSSLWGEPTATREQVTIAILARPTGEYTAHDVGGVIVPAYFDHCIAVGLNPIPVIAQCLHETDNLASWWAARPRRNPAGIGVNGRKLKAQPMGPFEAGVEWHFNGKLWVQGLAFATWEDDAIPAHVGRLLAYLVAAGKGSAIQKALIERALSYRPLDRKIRGSAKNLRQLGKFHNPSGEGWASPGKDYGRRCAAQAVRLERGR